MIVGVITTRDLRVTRQRAVDPAYLGVDLLELAITVQLALIGEAKLAWNHATL
jgi:hypothetical protein